MASSIPDLGPLTCQSEERADVSELEPVSKRLDGAADGRKNHDQVADCVPCSERQHGHRHTA